MDKGQKRRDREGGGVESSPRSGISSTRRARLKPSLLNDDMLFSFA